MQDEENFKFLPLIRVCPTRILEEIERDFIKRGKAHP